MRKARWLAVAVCVAILITVAGCTGERGISREPTDFMSFARAGADFVPTYYTEQHKAVQAVLQLTEQFLQADQNQDWHNLQWETGSLLTACPG